MNSRKTDKAHEYILNYLQTIDTRQATNGEYIFRCPKHSNDDGYDEHPSFSYNVEKRVGKCFSCHFSGNDISIAEALSFEYDTTNEARREVVEVYPYNDEHGNLLFEVVRYNPKGFNQRRPNSENNGKWIYNLNGIRRVLYRLPELIHCEKDSIVLILEGEKDVETARKLGFTATCNPGGAGKWNDEYNQSLKPFRVYIIPDNDDIGLKHGKQVFDAMTKSGVKAVLCPSLPRNCKDLADWVNAGGDREQLSKFLEESEAKQDGFPPEIKKKALQLISEGKLYSFWINHVQQVVVGEECNIKMHILSIASLKVICEQNEHQLSIVSKGGSASGKSHIASMVLRCIPKRYKLSSTDITPESLYYTDESLDGKIIFIKEEEGMEKCYKPIKQIITEGCISKLVTTKEKSNSGEKFISKQINKSASPCVIWTTTTKSRLDTELETRVVSLYTTMTKEHTKAILAYKGQKNMGKMPIRHDKDNELIIQCAFDSLKPFDVIIPYADKIANAFPTGYLRSRRDIDKIYTLIKASTIHHQGKREKTSQGQLVANKEDYINAFELLSQFLDFTYLQLSEVDHLIYEFLKEGDSTKKRVEIAGYLRGKERNIKDRSLRRHLEKLKDDGIIEDNGEHPNSKDYAYKALQLNKVEIKGLLPAYIFPDNTSDHVTMMTSIDNEKLNNPQQTLEIDQNNDFVDTHSTWLHGHENTKMLSCEGCKSYVDENRDTTWMGLGVCKICNNRVLACNNCKGNFSDAAFIDVCKKCRESL
ncbi:MAG: hypothetical protein HY606_14255 [Planctomycetes bacterium]|nr:hypothetical protein [Planctomycetota bacterium]